MSAGVLNFPMLRGWSLAGLGAEDSLSQGQVFAMMRPMISSVSDADLSAMIGQIMAKYAVVKTSAEASPSAKDDITKAIIDKLGYMTALTHKGELQAAFENIGKQGYSIILKSGSSPKALVSSAAPATVDAIVSNATTSGDGKEPAAIDTFNAAIDIVKSMAPGINAARQAEAAQKLLDKQASGKQIYRQKKTLTPWIIGGVGALVVLGIVYVAVKR